MSILIMVQWLKTFYGRLSSLLLMIAVFNLHSCTVYKAADTTMEAIQNTPQVMDNPDVYHYFVHDPYNSYRLTNMSFGDDGSLSGHLTPAVYQTPDSTWNRKERKEYWNDHKYDINIYTSAALNDLRAADDPEILPVEEGTVTLSGPMIERMTITSIDMEGELAGVALAILIVVGVLALLSLLITLLAIAAGANEEGSSDGSGSGSDSGSGTSSSGSSG